MGTSPVIITFLSANLALVERHVALVVGGRRAPDYLGAAWLHLVEAGTRRLAAGKPLDAVWLRYCAADGVKAALREEVGAYKTRDASGRTVLAFRVDSATLTDVGVTDDELQHLRPVRGGAASDRRAQRLRRQRAEESPEQRESRLASRRAARARVA